MGIAVASLRLFAFIPFKVFALMRRRWTARPKRTLPDWIALTIARGLSFAVVGGLVYVTYIVEMTSYDDFRKCSKSSTITRLEWVLGFRPAEDCRHF
jgi:drug/metabolite transporter (DMT)-like permease